MSKRLLTSIECENKGWAQILKPNECNKKYGALGWTESIDGFFVVEIPDDAKFEGL